MWRQVILSKNSENVIFAAGNGFAENKKIFSNPTATFWQENLAFQMNLYAIDKL